MPKFKIKGERRFLCCPDCREEELHQTGREFGLYAEFKCRNKHFFQYPINEVEEIR